MIESIHWHEPTLSIYHFQELASTNPTAWQLFQQGKKPPFVVTADQQTDGKGQWGRKWASPLGGLYLSLILAPKIAIEQPSYLTISSVFGVTELLSYYQIPVQIKWLNDIFLNGKKLGGVLTETRIQNQQLKAVMIGIGINWSNRVPEMGIALRDYLLQSQIEATFTPPTALPRELNNQNLPQKITTLGDLKLIVLTGLLFGFDRYSQEGLSTILPQYEARLLSE